MDNTKIIVVEDNIVYCEFVCNLLAREGFRTVQAFHLSTAKKYLQQAADGDIVVSDLRLPDGNGIDLLRWMRKEGRMQPFVIMTDYAEVHTAVESMKLGSLDYIPKQLVEDKLVPLLRNILKERHTGRSRMPLFSRDDIRGKRHGQGAYRPPAARQGQAGRKAVCGCGLRFAHQRACAVGFLRTRQRRVHGCGQCQERLFP